MASPTSTKSQKPGAKAQPKPMTRRRLENIAKYHVERFATTATNLKRVLIRRAERAIRVHGGDRTEVAGWAEEAVAKLVKSGAVNDHRYAMDRAASLRRLGKGPEKIRSLLIAKGVDRALAKAALEATAEADDGTDAALTAAIAYAKRRRLGPFGVQEADKDARRKKATKDLSALGRAGFSYAIAKLIAHAASAEDLA